MKNFFILSTSQAYQKHRIEIFTLKNRKKSSAYFILRSCENNLKVSSVLQSQLALKHLNCYLLQGEFS